MTTFLTNTPTLEDNWRAIILFGKNTASYKFALGKALLSLGKSQDELIRLDDLALPYATALCDHLKQAPSRAPSRRAHSFRNASDALPMSTPTSNCAMQR